MVIVKYIIIDHHRRLFGSYAKKVYEVELDEGESLTFTDAGEIGRYIHDQRYGPEDKRRFVKVLGIEGA
jgi:hypothetical protein